MTKRSHPKPPENSTPSLDGARQPSSQEFWEAYQKLSQDWGYQLAVEPVFQPTGLGTFVVSVKITVIKLGERANT